MRRQQENPRSSAMLPAVLAEALKTAVVAGLLLLPLCGHALQTDAGKTAKALSPEIADGIKLLQTGDAASAKAHFSSALAANPKSTDALTWRGIAENQLNQYAEAVRDFEAALRLDPGKVSARDNLAMSLIRLGQYRRAIEELKVVVKAHPGALEPEFNLAILLEREHATAEAVEHLNAAHRANPGDAQVTQHLLVDLAALGRVNEARSLFEQIMANGSPAARQGAGVGLLEAGDYRDAVLLLERARERGQPSLENDLILARAEIGAEEDFKAIDLLKPLEATDKSGEAAYWLGMAYVSAGATEEAKSAFEDAARLNPRNGRALYHLGMMEAAEPDQTASAVGHLQEAMRLEPENPNYGVALGKLLLQEDKAKDALEVLRGIHAEGAVGGERDLLLGIAQITQSGSNSAIPALLRSIGENPSLALTYNILGFCYFDEGDLAKATVAYKKASDLSPATKIFAHGAAVAFDRMNSIPEAMVYAQRAVQLPSSGAEDYLLLGKLLAQERRDSEAIAALQKAISLDPELESGYFLLAQSYQRTGNAKQAAQCIATLKDLKRRHEQEYAVATKGAKPVASSTLLQGAPMASAEPEGPERSSDR